MKQTCVFLGRERTFEDAYVFADMTVPDIPVFVHVNANYFWTGKNADYVDYLGEPK